MPEGHTIHRLARDQAKRFTGQTIRTCSPQGRFEQGAREINGDTIRCIEAYGKHLFYWWSRGPIMHVHLGLYGRFRLHKRPEPEPRGAVRLRAVGETHAFDLSGPTACELLDESGRRRIVDRLGEDPLRDDSRREIAEARIMGSRGAIGRLLLDQSVIAGVGNIFRAEALFECGIHPERAGNTLSEHEARVLWETLAGYLHVGVKYNRIITAHPDEMGVSRGRMKKDQRLRIYGKETCPYCGDEAREWDLGARKIFACETCQPPG